MSCCEMSNKTLRCCNGIFTVIGLAFAVVILALTAYSSIQYSRGNIFLEAAVNWYREIITDVTLVDPVTGQCQYDKQSAIQFTFMGFDTGCDCSATGGTVKSGKCSSSQSSCQNVKAVPQTILQNWVDASGNPIRLCFQRLLNYKFTQKYLKSGTCRDPVNEKMCGGTDPMTAFCVPNSSPCPVQSISTSKVNPSDTQIGTTGLWIQRGIPNQGHLSEMYISEKQGMCPDYLYTYWDGTSQKYPLSNNVYSQCTVDTTYWLKVQDISKASYFTANNMQPSTFPGFVASQQQSLQQRKYLPWNMSCRDGTQLADVVDIAMNYDTDKSNHKMLMYVSIATVSVLGVYFLFLILGCFTSKIDRKCCSVRGCCKIDCCCCPCLKEGCTISWCTLRAPKCIQKCWMRKNGSDSCWDYIFLVDPLHFLLIIVTIGLDLAMLGLSVMNFAKTKSYKNTMSSVASQNCSTPDFNNNLKSTSDTINNIITPVDAVVLALTVIYLIGSVVAIYTYACNTISKRRQIIKQKLETKKMQELEEVDQEIPTLETIVVQPTQVNNPNNSIQMQLNPTQPVPQYGYTPNQPTPFVPQQVPIGQPYGQNPYVAQQPMMYQQQQPMMYPQQQQPQQQQVYYKPY